MIEILVATALIAVALIMIVSVVPTGIFSIKRAADFQSASTYGNELLEDARVTALAYPSYPVTDRNLSITLNNTVFHVTRDVYAVDGKVPHRLFDVVVSARWTGQPVPQRFYTRIYVSQ